MKIVITGAAGLIGRHVALSLSVHEAYASELITLDRKSFSDEASRKRAVADADVVVHCAGVNRGSDGEVEEGNAQIAQQLVVALQESGATPQLIFMNSTHRDSDTPYGRGKTAAHEHFRAWAEATGAAYCEFVLPHVFGEGGRPFYNSAVHSFCHQLAHGEPLEVNGAGQLELLHARDVALAVEEAIAKGTSGARRVDGARMSVATAAGRLTDLHRQYVGLVVPDLRNRLDLQLFNTLRSFMFPAHYPRALTLHTDDRGSLFEGVKNLNGGQAFLSTTHPGITRGNHFHFDKVERFLVVSGEAVIRIRSMGSDHVEEFYVRGDAPAYVDMPTLHTHSITNVGSTELLTMFWSNEIFDPARPDTYFEPVLKNGS